MTKPKNSQIALVTGARTGIGRHLAEHLLGKGYAVVGCSRKPVEWTAEGFRYYQTDIANEREVKSLFREITKLYGRLDVAINNAGAASMNHFLLTPVETYRRLVDTNLLGTWLVSQEAAKLMRRHKHGRIINFSTVAVPLRLAGEAAYVASKSAVTSLSQVMARELAEFGITVNVVAPGPVDTELIRGVPKEKIERLISSMPIQRLCTFEDVTNVVDFFLRPESDAITAQVIHLCGVPN